MRSIKVLHATPPRCISLKCPSVSAFVWFSAPDTGHTADDHAHTVVKYLWCGERLQGVGVDILTENNFGMPEHHYSLCPSDPRGNPVSTARFLPTNDELPTNFHWKITATSQVPSNLQRRQLWIHVSKPAGRPLIHAKTPWDLYVAVGHGMLGAHWL